MQPASHPPAAGLEMRPMSGSGQGWWSRRGHPRAGGEGEGLGKAVAYLSHVSEAGH